MALVEEQMDPVSFSVPRPTLGRRGRRGGITPLFWTQICQGLLIMAVAAGINGGVALNQLARRAYLEMAEKFSWMVLVSGDPLQIDEVGGQLKQLPGARDVVFVTPESAFQELQADPLYFGDTNAFEAADLPASWHVRWDPQSVDFSLLPLFAEDMRHVGGVIEVAYDPRHLEMIHRLRVNRYAIQTVLWMAGLASALAILFLFGRVLFFGRLFRGSSRSIALFFLRDELWWLAGFALVWKFLGHVVPWPFLLGGLIVGLVHLSWESLEKR